MDSTDINIVSERLWNVSRAAARRLLTSCFLLTVAVPISLGFASPLLFLIWLPFGFALTMVSRPADARSLCLVSALSLAGGIAALWDSWSLDVAFLLLVFGVLLLIESHRRLAKACSAPQAVNHLRTAQILILMASSSVFLPRPETDLVTGLAFSANYGLVLMTGCFLALGYNRWSKEMTAPVVPESDLSL
jgi:hypothetical protein